MLPDSSTVFTRLAVHDGRARVRMPPDTLTLGSVQGRIEPMQGVLATELPEMVEHGLKGEGNCRGDSATDSRCAAQRRWRRGCDAVGACAVCRAARVAGDSVERTPIPHRSG